MSNIPKLKDIVLRDTPFAELMNKRIYNVLLIATKYDAFMLEDDGRVDEQIFNEYAALGLRYPPRFTQVTTEEEALKASTPCCTLAMVGFAFTSLNSS